MPEAIEEKQKEKERQAKLGLPTFRYHPNPLEIGAFEEFTTGIVCDCCGKEIHIFYTNPFFSVEDIEYLCPALQGHIQYFAASYSKSADHESHFKRKPYRK